MFLQPLRSTDRAATPTEPWSLGGACPDTIRSMPEVFLLPDVTVFCAAGKREAGAELETNEWEYTRLADMKTPREYHAITLLAPDGRVIVTSGAGQPAHGGGHVTVIEAFEPPYLFCGIRPRIDSVPTTTLKRGESFTLTVSRAAAITKLVLMGTNEITHWLDGGVPCLAEVPFETTDGDGQPPVPDEPLRLPVGWYHLIAMVDDSPSNGIIVRVGEA